MASRGVCAWLVLLVAGCGQSAATTGDSAAPDTAIDAPDVAGTDASGTDATGTDAAADVGVPDSSLNDAPGTDAAGGTDAGSADLVTDVAEDTAPSCTSLQAQIDALKPGLKPCSGVDSCTVFEYPICNTMGCFQTPVAKGADTTKLESLATEAGKAGCPGFHCGCGPYAPAFCLKGACRQCPPDCDGTCEELTSVLTTAAHAANNCTIDKDCTTLSTGLCPVGDLPCGGLFLNQNVDTTALQAIITGFSQACGASMCKCAVPLNPVCVKGQCVAP